MRKIRTNESMREYERNIPLETKLNVLTKEGLDKYYVRYNKSKEKYEKRD